MKGLLSTLGATRRSAEGVRRVGTRIGGNVEGRTEPTMARTCESPALIQRTRGFTNVGVLRARRATVRARVPGCRVKIAEPVGVPTPLA